MVQKDFFTTQEGLFVYNELFLAGIYEVLRIYNPKRISSYNNSLINYNYLYYFEISRCVLSPMAQSWANLISKNRKQRQNENSSSVDVLISAQEPTLIPESAALDELKIASTQALINPGTTLPGSVFNLETALAIVKKYATPFSINRELNKYFFSKIGNFPLELEILKNFFRNTATPPSFLLEKFKFKIKRPQSIEPNSLEEKTFEMLRYLLCNLNVFSVSAVNETLERLIQANEKFDYRKENAPKKNKKPMSSTPVTLIKDSVLRQNNVQPIHRNILAPIVTSAVSDRLNSENSETLDSLDVFYAPIRVLRSEGNQSMTKLLSSSSIFTVKNRDITASPIEEESELDNKRKNKFKH